MGERLVVQVQTLTRSKLTKPLLPTLQTLRGLPHKTAKVETMIFLLLYDVELASTKKPKRKNQNQVGVRNKGKVLDSDGMQKGSPEPHVLVKSVNKMV